MTERPAFPFPCYSLKDKDGELVASRKYVLAEPYDDNGNYIILETYWVAWINYKEGVWRRQTIPGQKEYGDKAYITDFASVPREFRGILETDGAYRNDALKHDVDYMWQGNYPTGWREVFVNGEWVDDPKKVGKLKADWEMFRGMTIRLINWFTRVGIYAALLIGGWLPWFTTDKTREMYRNVFEKGGK